jgi:FKBP-type peptidyl-prolyl cis-trans isomerase
MDTLAEWTSYKNEATDLMTTTPVSAEEEEAEAEEEAEEAEEAEEEEEEEEEAEAEEEAEEEAEAEAEAEEEEEAEAEAEEEEEAEAEAEEEEAEEEEEELCIVIIKKVKYATFNQVDSDIYEVNVDENGDDVVGEVVGKYADGVPVITKKKEKKLKTKST